MAYAPQAKGLFQLSKARAVSAAPSCQRLAQDAYAEGLSTWPPQSFRVSERRVVSVIAFRICSMLI